MFFSLDNYIKIEDQRFATKYSAICKFVKDVLTQFGAITQYDAKTKTLTCNKFSIIDDNRIFAPDWSKKIDLTKPPKVDFTKVVSKYLKGLSLNTMRSDDSDVLNKIYSSITNYTLGDGALVINNDFLS